MTGAVVATRHAGVMTLTLDNPSRRNALSLPMLEQIASAAQALCTDDTVRCLILTGAETAFCSGGDLDAMSGSDVENFQRMEDQLARTMAMVSAVPVPVIARINGACFGAGVQLALTADLRIAADQAKFGIPAAKIGLVYPPQAVARLAALVGPGHAGRMLLTGLSIDAREALRIGLVEEVAADAEFSAHCLKVADTIASMPPEGLRATLALVRGASQGLDEAALSRIQAAAHSPDYLKQVLARIARSRAK